MTQANAEEMTLRLPEIVGEPIAEIEGEGTVVLHLDRLRDRIKALPLAQLAEFIAGPVAGLFAVAEAAQNEARDMMVRRELKELPLADGRKIVVKKSVRYNPLPEAIVALETRLTSEGFVAGTHFDPLRWEETIPAQTIVKVAGVPQLRKALKLGGVADKDQQDEWLGKFEGEPRLSIEAK